jgi:hypothetical protein
MPADRAGAKQRFTRAWVGGSLVSTLAYWWMDAEGRLDLFRYHSLNSNFYDAQARAMLHGKLQIPLRILKIEGFTHDGKQYMYFPPFPAFLRLPFVAVTDSLDGRLTAVSMLAAFVLAITAAGVLTWRVRGLTRGDVPVGRTETIAVVLFALLLGVGSPLYFTASRAWIYHESAAWGMAFVVCAFDQIIAFLRGPTGRRLARASVFGGCAILSRAATGAGALLALSFVLGVVVVVSLWPRARRWLGWTAVPEVLFRRPRWIGGLAAAIAIPAVVYAAFNYAKFETLFSIPYDHQVQSQIDPHRQQVLAANHGSLFTVKAIPTQIWQYLRPDAMRVHGTFPWIGGPLGLPHVFGNLLFDYREHTVSVTAGMPVLVVLAAVGAVAIVRNRALSALRLAALAALVVLPASLSILYIAQRYESDLFPLMLLLAAPGLFGTVTWLERRTVPWRRSIVVAFAALVALGCWTGVAVALEYQRDLSALVPTSLRREYVGWQWRVADTVGFGKPAVLTGGSLPAPAHRGALFVVGPCAGLYVSDGDRWHAVERANAGGHFRVQVDGRALQSGPITLVRAGSGADEWTVELVPVGDGRAALVERARDLRSRSFAIGGDDVFDIVFDPGEGWLTVYRGDYELWTTPYHGQTADFAASDEVRNLPVPTSLCRRVLRSLD